MASPQIENGYLKIANELALVLARTKLTGRQWLVVWAVLAKTYGWNKKEDQISLTQFQKMTLLSRPTICDCIHRLVAMQVLGSSKIGTSSNVKYWIEKDYNKWKVPSSYVGTSSNFATRASSKTPLKLVPVALHTKDNTKDILKTVDFTPPSPEDVTRYCQERKNNVDPNKWHNFYTAKGWMIGKNKMKDWKAAIRTWETSTPEKAKKWL